MRFLRVPLALALVAAGCSRAPARPNILLITLDTTRRDHLGMYGYDVPTSPSLDRLAADALVYTNAYAVSSWTLPTHASMFTGKFPSAHGANYDPEGPLNLGEGIPGLGHYRARPIADDETTLAQVLGEHGYHTGGIIAGPWLLEIFRLGKGFQHYDDSGVTALNGRPADDVTRAAIEYVDEHADEPFFLFLNYYDPHNPWWGEPPRPNTLPPCLQDVKPLVPAGVNSVQVDKLSYSKLCYDAEIRFMDDAIGKLLEHLRARGLYENTWIFVLSDHGDLMGDPILDPEPLWGHGDSLTQPEIHIPFVVKEPGPLGRKGPDPTPVQQTDILPAIFARLEIPLPKGVQGTPLDGKHPIVAELYKLPMMNRTWGDDPKDWRHLGNWRVLVNGNDKYGWSSNGTHFLVDLAGDPGERNNLLTSQAELARELDAALDVYLRHLPRPGEVGAVEPLTEEEMEMLKSLGYTGEEDSPPDTDATDALDGAPGDAAPESNRSREATEAVKPQKP